MCLFNKKKLMHDEISKNCFLILYQLKDDVRFQIKRKELR